LAEARQVALEMTIKPEVLDQKKLLYLQAAIVVLLVSQSCSYVLIRQYVQTSSKLPDSNLVLLVAEFQKLLISAAAIYILEGPVHKSFHEFCSEGSVMLLPAVAYLIMNLLSFYSLKYISASLFITMAQMKTLTTALFSVLILNVSLPPSKCFSLFLLVFGCILVTQQERRDSHSHSEVVEVDSWHFFLGLFAVILEVTISGLISAYYERILKHQKASVWERNAQLAFLSIILYSANYYSESESTIIDKIVDWNWPIFITSTLGACGGLLVAACMKYLSSVVKCIILSFSVILTLFLSHFIFNSTLTTWTLLGAFLVVLASILYNQNERIDKYLLGIDSSIEAKN